MKYALSIMVTVVASILTAAEVFVEGQAIRANGQPLALTKITGKVKLHQHPTGEADYVATIATLTEQDNVTTDKDGYYAFTARNAELDMATINETCGGEMYLSLSEVKEVGKSEVLVAETLPRMRMGVAPYALRAKSADGFTGGLNNQSNIEVDKFTAEDINTKDFSQNGGTINVGWLVGFAENVKVNGDIEVPSDSIGSSFMQGETLGGIHKSTDTRSGKVRTSWFADVTGRNGFERSVDDVFYFNSSGCGTSGEWHTQVQKTVKVESDTIVHMTIICGRVDGCTDVLGVTLSTDDVLLCNRDTCFQTYYTSQSADVNGYPEGRGYVLEFIVRAGGYFEFKGEWQGNSKGRCDCWVAYELIELGDED